MGGGREERGACWKHMGECREKNREQEGVTLSFRSVGSAGPSSGVIGGSPGSTTHGRGTGGEGCMPDTHGWASREKRGASGHNPLVPLRWQCWPSSGVVGGSLGSTTHGRGTGGEKSALEGATQVDIARPHGVALCLSFTPCSTLFGFPSSVEHLSQPCAVDFQSYQLRMSALVGRNCLPW